MVLMSSYSPFWDSTFCLGNQIECGRKKFITKITYLQKNLEIDQLRIISYLAPVIWSAAYYFLSCTCYLISRVLFLILHLLPDQLRIISYLANVIWSAAYYFLSCTRYLIWILWSDLLFTITSCATYYLPNIGEILYHIGYVKNWLI